MKIQSQQSFNLYKLKMDQLISKFPIMDQELKQLHRDLKLKLKDRQDYTNNKTNIKQYFKHLNHLNQQEQKNNIEIYLNDQIQDDFNLENLLSTLDNSLETLPYHKHIYQYIFDLIDKKSFDNLQISHLQEQINQINNKVREQKNEFYLEKSILLQNTELINLELKDIDSKIQKSKETQEILINAYDENYIQKIQEIPDLNYKIQDIHQDIYNIQNQLENQSEINQNIFIEKAQLQSNNLILQQQNNSLIQDYNNGQSQLQDLQKNIQTAKNENQSLLEQIQTLENQFQFQDKNIFDQKITIEQLIKNKNIIVIKEDQPKYDNHNSLIMQKNQYEQSKILKYSKSLKQSFKSSQIL